MQGAGQSYLRKNELAGYYFIVYDDDTYSTFDIKDGTVFVDAVLPVQRMGDGSVRLQILGVSVVDPDAQPFGVLGFQFPPAPPTVRTGCGRTPSAFSARIS